ncbi:hypothetical protein RFI_09594, partial [Reticulomyxa filosa]
ILESKIGAKDHDLQQAQKIVSKGDADDYDSENNDSDHDDNDNNGGDEETNNEKEDEEVSKNKVTPDTMSRYSHEELLEYLKTRGDHSVMTPWIDYVRNHPQIDGLAFATIDETHLQSAFRTIDSKKLLPLTAFLMRHYLQHRLSSINTNANENVDKADKDDKDDIHNSRNSTVANVARDLNSDKFNADENDTTESETEKKLQEKIQQLEREIQEMEKYLCDKCKSGKKTYRLNPCYHFHVLKKVVRQSHFNVIIEQKKSCSFQLESPKLCMISHKKSSKRASTTAKKRLNCDANHTKQNKITSMLNNNLFCNYLDHKKREQFTKKKRE